MTARRKRLCFFMLLLVCVELWPDAWGLPSPTKYVSDNAVYYLTVYPRELRDQTSYLSDIMEGIRPAGQLVNGRRRCLGRLEKQNVTGDATLVWEGFLINDVAPGSAIVSNDGKFFATFDNWGSLGYGPDVIVIYTPKGGKEVQFSLNDILTPEEISRLPEKNNSLWWGGNHFFLYADSGPSYLVVRTFDPFTGENYSEKYIRLPKGELEEREANPGLHMEIVEFGLYARINGVWCFQSETTKISPNLGDQIGFKAFFDGPKGMMTSLIVRIIHPKITNPQNGRTTTAETVAYPNLFTQSTRTVGWVFEHEWEIVPGDWVVQFMDEENVLAEKKFTVE